MSMKIKTLMVLVTLVFWLGHGSGCATSAEEQNYKLLNEPARDMFDAEPRPDQPGAKAPTPATLQLASVEREATMVVETGEAAVINDRSHWSTITVAPLPGYTEHWPHHFRDLKMWRSEDPSVNLDAGGDEPMRQALRGERARGPFNARNGVELLVQPVKLAVDLVIWPVKALAVEPVWRPVTTPPQPQAAAAPVVQESSESAE